MNQKSHSSTLSQSEVYDQGLRAYMINIYNYMAAGVGLTGLIAFFVSQNPALLSLVLTPPLSWVIMFAPLGIVLFMGTRFQKMSPSAVNACFWAYAALLGLSLSGIFLAYTGADIARSFFGAAAGFGAMSLYGYTTKKSLTGWGSFLFIGVIGVFICSLINMFVGSSLMQMVISSVAVIVFAGLTAYDTQNIKNGYDYVSGDAQMAKKMSIYGAFGLYINFIAMFVHLLQLTSLMSGDD